MAVPGVSTLGIKFGYAAESTAGTKPSSFTLLTRINQIGGISLDTEQIDASALEDEISKYVSGRADTGGTFNVTVNATNDTITEWQSVISTFAALTGGKQMWFNTYSPKLNKSFFVIAEPPAILPQPEMGQNELFTMEIPLVIVDFKGVDAAIIPTAAA